MSIRILCPLLIAALAALPAQAREAHHEFGLAGLGEAVRALSRSTQSRAIEGTAVSLHRLPIVAPIGAPTVLFSHTADNVPVLAIATDQNPRLTRAEWSVLRDTKLGDGVFLRGRCTDVDGRTMMMLDDIKQTRPPRDEARLGTLEDVLMGPLPMPAMIDLQHGKKFFALVVSREQKDVRLRTSLAEMTVPAASIKTAKRMGGGTSCRTGGKGIDYLVTLPLDGPADKVFAAAAAHVHANEKKGHTKITGALIGGVRSGPRHGIIVRTEDHGDLLIFLNSGPNQRQGGTYARRQLVASLCMERGAEVMALVKRTFSGLHLCSGTESLRIRDPNTRETPTAQPDPEILQLDKDRRSAVELLFEGFGRSIDAGQVRTVLDMDATSQRIILRTLALKTDWGQSAAADAMHTLVGKLPAEAVPPEATAAALRGIFMYENEDVRVECAEILGAVGCREGVAALEQAMQFFPGNRFAKAATRAIDQIRAAPPR
jgi:hypothetical protein